MAAILIQYQVHPENTVLHLLREFFPMTGITERKGFETRIIQGHPLFSESVNQGNNNSEFPAIGVEHTSDIRTDSIGQNFSRFRNSQVIREFFQKEKLKPMEERIATDSMLDRLTTAPILNKFLCSVKSIVSIAGYCSGITAKNQNHFRATLNQAYFLRYFCSFVIIWCILCFSNRRCRYAGSNFITKLFYRCCSSLRWLLV